MVEQEQTQPTHQEIKCDRCGNVAIKKQLDWKRKSHCKEVVCAPCSAHLVTKG